MVLSRASLPITHAVDLLSSGFAEDTMGTDRQEGSACGSSQHVSRSDSNGARLAQAHKDGTVA